MRLVLSLVLSFALLVVGGLSAANAHMHETEHQMAGTHQVDDRTAIAAPTCCDAAADRSASSCHFDLALVPVRLALADTGQALRHRIAQARAPNSVLPKVPFDPPKA